MMKTLVVDDDPISRFLLQEILAPYGEIHSCVNGAEAVQAYQRSIEQGAAYSLICLDIMMPDTTGFQALQAIREIEARQNPRGPAAKILMTTALHDSGAIVNAFHEQCDGYLVKPIEKAKLLDTVRGFGLPV